MAFAWPFRTRSEGRDRDTDLSRVQRLSKAIDEIRSSVANELKGLEARYQSTAADAAFLNQAIENGEASESRNANVDEMVGTMKRYRQRTESLARQLAVLDAMRQSAEALADEN
jgi:hypothetical protein